MRLSEDLRRRIVEAYQNKEGSMRQLAKRFKVGWITVWRLLKQYRQTGSLVAKPYSGGKAACVQGEQVEVFCHLVQTRADLTLAELAQAFKAETGIELSVSTVHNTCQRYRLTRKKKSAYAQEQESEEVKKSAKPLQHSGRISMAIN